KKSLNCLFLFLQRYVCLGKNNTIETDPNHFTTQGILAGIYFFRQLSLSLARFLKNIRLLKDDWQGFGR
ncbi:MAG TPA: hypothetical protein DCM71_10535, partial [Runella sp.]|nr:hypothetical protein [Runella sp.]